MNILAMSLSVAPKQDGALTIEVIKKLEALNIKGLKSFEKPRVYTPIIRKYLDHNGMSQIDFCERYNLSRFYLTQMMTHGRMNPKSEKMFDDLIASGVLL